MCDADGRVPFLPEHGERKYLHPDCGLSQWENKESEVLLCIRWNSGYHQSYQPWLLGSSGVKDTTIRSCEPIRRGKPGAFQGGLCPSQRPEYLWTEKTAGKELAYPWQHPDGIRGQRVPPFGCNAFCVGFWRGKYQCSRCL